MSLSANEGTWVGNHAAQQEGPPSDQDADSQPEPGSEGSKSEVPPDESDDISFTQAIRIQEAPGVY